MPNTVMEAMASGLPVVCTDAGGVRELVRSGENGWIVPCRQPEALAERMLHLMSLDPAERRALGAAGRARIVREFDLERVVDHWEDLLRTLARQAPPGG
jgi:glycosyltransferase involved in cell wall biosynthesis